MRREPMRALLPAKVHQNQKWINLYDGVVFLAALLIVALRIEVAGCLVFLSLIGVTLVLSDRLSDIFLPLVLMTVFVTRCYDSFDVFVKYIPLYAAVLLCLVFHLIYYWAKPTFGPTFPGLVAVTAALTLGGIGSLSAAAYFRPMNLYYVLCLGILMPVLYIVAKPRANEEARDRCLRGLFLMGCLAVFAVLTFYVRGWAQISRPFHVLTFQSKNNIATFLMISMPIGFFYSKQRRVLIVVPVIQYLAILFCNSRGGLLLGTAEFLLLLVFFCFYRSDWFRRAFFIGLFVLTVVMIFVLLPKAVTFYQFERKIKNYADLSHLQLFRALLVEIFNDEGRGGLLGRSITDFKSNPLFGAGLGNTANSDLYAGVKGTMVWYHMWLPQIWGSLGIVGLLAFGYQLYLRIRLSFSRRDFPDVTLSFCYLGLLLMSQVNPGEFCPFPYAVIATVIFILLEPPAQVRNDVASDENKTE